MPCARAVRENHLGGRFARQLGKGFPKYLPKSTTAGMLFGPQLRQGFPLSSTDRVMVDSHWLVILLLFSFACGYAFHAQKFKR